jgi:uncharacterized protein YoxC
MASLITAEAIARSSRKNALLSAIGVGILIFSVAFSYLQLNQTEKRLKAMKSEIEVAQTQQRELLAQRSAIEATIEDQRRQVNALTKEVEAKKLELGNLRANIDNFKSTSSSEYGTAGSALGVKGDDVYEVRATSIRTGGETSHGPEYRITAQISANPDVLSSIEKVTYRFDHPSFRQPEYTVIDARNNFRFTYLGWGCLEHVDVKIYFKDGHVRDTDFEMCKALVDVPTKK